MTTWVKVCYLSLSTNRPAKYLNYPPSRATPPSAHSQNLRADIKEFCASGSKVTPRQASIKQPHTGSESESDEEEQFYDEPYDDSIFEETPQPDAENYVDFIDGNRRSSKHGR